MQTKQYGIGNILILKIKKMTNLKILTLVILITFIGITSFTLPQPKNNIKINDVCWVDWNPSNYGMCRNGNEGEVSTEFETKLEAENSTQPEKEAALSKHYRVYFICGTLTIIGWEVIPF
jgi:hypothetical protein